MGKALEYVHSVKEMSHHECANEKHGIRRESIGLSGEQ